MIGTDEFSDEQWAVLKDLIPKKMIQYKDIEVIGHNQVSKKYCPGFDVQWYLRKIL
jgi:N-acetyl-anhydromuramyl-L-alanine amidase AmpD